MNQMVNINWNNLVQRIQIINRSLSIHQKCLLVHLEFHEKLQTEILFICVGNFPNHSYTINMKYWVHSYSIRERELLKAWENAHVPLIQNYIIVKWQKGRKEIMILLPSHDLAHVRSHLTSSQSLSSEVLQTFNLINVAT